MHLIWPKYSMGPRINRWLKPLNWQWGEVPSNWWRWLTPLRPLVCPNVTVTWTERRVYKGSGFKSPPSSSLDFQEHLYQEKSKWGPRSSLQLGHWVIWEAGPVGPLASLEGVLCFLCWFNFSIWLMLLLKFLAVLVSGRCSTGQAFSIGGLQQRKSFIDRLNACPKNEDTKNSWAKLVAPLSTMALTSE